MLLRTIFALLGTIALSGTIHAGVLTSLLSIESASGRVGASVDLAVLLDNGSGDLQGWSFGVCHDPASLTLTALLAGSTALSVNNGEPASFLQLSEEPGGYTAGVVVCLTGCANLPIGNGYELTVGSYTIDGAVGTTTDVCPCSTLGSPSVATVLVIGGSSAPASLACGTVEAIPLPLEVQFVRGDANDDGAVDIGDGIWMLAELFSKERVSTVRPRRTRTLMAASTPRTRSRSSTTSSSPGRRRPPPSPSVAQGAWGPIAKNGSRAPEPPPPSKKDDSSSQLNSTYPDRTNPSRPSWRGGSFLGLNQ